MNESDRTPFADLLLRHPEHAFLGDVPFKTSSWSDYDTSAPSSRHALLAMIHIRRRNARMPLFFSRNTMGTLGLHFIILFSGNYFS